eukprot:2251411-Rhodomonas_salina.1
MIGARMAVIAVCGMRRRGVDQRVWAVAMDRTSARVSEYLQVQVCAVCSVMPSRSAGESTASKK